MLFQEVGDGVVVGIRVTDGDGAVSLCGIWEGFRYPEGGVYLRRELPEASVPINTLIAAFERARGA